jgi:hypothetical protein
MAANTRASSNPNELTMELRKFFGQSGKVYYVTHSPETYWKAFVETRDGFVTVEAKTAARDCGAQFEDNPNTHVYWGHLWNQSGRAANR